MTVSLRRSFFIGFWIIVSLVLGACGGLNRRSAVEHAAPVEEARQLLVSLSDANPSLSAFKGVGKIKMWNPDRSTVSERVAWVGASPESLRIEVLVSGRSMIKFSTDGRHMYFIDLRDPEPSLTKMRTIAPDLQHLASLPVKIREIVELMAGRPPSVNYSDVHLIRQTGGDGYILVLEKWWRITEKIYLNKDRSEIEKVEVFNNNQRLRYRVIFNRMQDVRGYRVPARLTITDEKGAGLILDIDRYLTDVSITPSVFVLSPPDTH